MTRLDVNLPDALKAFIEEQVARRGYKDASAFVQSVLEAERQRQVGDEVRTARQVAHPNVCRVYDIGEHERQLYLSMEFVDGEDLAASLRRVGRFPEDKGLDLAR